ncbi:hypothetical protein CEY16_03415 [Halalkalibacillus sediminis]|uniref:Uncharacterized protein n=1 Tax=Halalkalibacillus sediminis TaxID=2018042 RepID=A0A2I0QWX6_9BACI|nr:SLOG family protein [Halalkalibacillus sediminis]PKR78814.1 hypothetical protein CEY16_03415 [Halalkalibacillus sediminis]
MEIKSLYITGYKPHELNIFSDEDQKVLVIKNAIRKKLIQLIEEGLEWIVVSGQMGIEAWGFDVVQDLKNEYPIKIALIPPFKDQEKIWKEDRQTIYRQMCDQADFFQVLTNKPYESPKQYVMKNRWMIEKTDACLMVFEEEYGGSPKYFYDLVRSYQEMNPYELIVLSSFDLEDMAREMTEENDEWI